MLLLLLALSSFIASIIDMPLFRTEGKNLQGWRRALFYAGSISNAVSASVLLIFLTHAHRIAYGGMPFLDLDRVYPVFLMPGLGLIGTILGAFGMRWSRALLAIAGIVAACSWYLAALAVSP